MSAWFLLYEANPISRCSARSDNGNQIPIIRRSFAEFAGQTAQDSATRKDSFLNALHDTLRSMNFCPSSRQRLFLGLAPIFLFVGLAAMAQQAADDKSKTEIPRAGVNGVGMPRCEYCPDPEYSKEAKKEEV